MMHLSEVINKPEVVSAFAANVTILPFDKKAATVAGKIMNELKDRGDGGQKMNESVMTAAICMANDAFLFAKSNAKFDGIKGLKKV
jgi:predicted nucleic acid-binding protein